MSEKFCTNTDSTNKAGEALHKSRLRLTKYCRRKSARPPSLTGKTKKTLQLFRINCYAIGRNDMAKENDFVEPELTLGEFCIESVLSQLLHIGMSTIWMEKKTRRDTSITWGKIFHTTRETTSSHAWRNMAEYFSRCITREHVAKI